MKVISTPFLLLLIFIFLPTLSQATTEELIRYELKTNKNGILTVGSTKIAATKLIRNFYQYSDYQLAWKDQAKIDTLLEAIDKADSLGLTPGDYHQSEIKARIEKGLNGEAAQRVQLDIILTDALVRLVYHLSYGKVVPGSLDPDWNFSREFMTSDPVAKLHYILRSKKKLKSFLDKNIHIGPFYQGLIKALAEYRRIQKSGGWNTIATGKTLKPGMQDPRIPLIKARLQISDDLKKSTIIQNDDTYNVDVEAGVKHFQLRHQIEPDGILGKGTLEQMNHTVEYRINQIKANLERIRWIRHNLGDEFVLVNIAGYKVYYVQDNKVIWESRAQVGKEYRKTPVFRDDIKYLVFNPTWTVPPTILRNDILPKLKKDPGYLQKKNMNVVDLKGKIINSSNINWSTTTAKNFPYMIRQEPGPGNALGRVKIMFPNKHMVYLHDTPSKSMFDRAERAFSSGCIRIENPFELVELLLKDSSKWNQEKFKEILDSQKLRNVSLPKSVPVLLLYFTSRMDKDGRVMFYKDIYSRDEKIIHGLKQPFHLLAPKAK